MTHIGEHPLPEMYRSGIEVDSQCARCGSSTDFQRCDSCGGDGLIYDLVYDLDDDGEDEVEDCPYCDGQGGWWCCLSSPDWCEANPQPGREDVERGMIEWFTIERGERP